MKKVFRMLCCCMLVIGTMLMSSATFQTAAASEPVEVPNPTVLERLCPPTEDEEVPVTRLEAIVCLMKMMGMTREEAFAGNMVTGFYEERFDDLPARCYVDYGYAREAERQFLMPGIQDFHRDQPITLAETLSVMNHMLSPETNKRVDWLKIVPEEEVQKAFELGILTEVESQTLAPDGEVSHALFRTLVSRMLSMTPPDSETTYEETLKNDPDIWSLSAERAEGAGIFAWANRSDITNIALVGEVGYHTQDKNEIAYLSYLFRVLPVSDEKTEAHMEEKGMLVMLQYADGQSVHFTVTPDSLLCDNTAYVIPDGAYDHLQGVVKGLNDKTLSVGEVSFTPSSWADAGGRTEWDTIHFGIWTGLLPRRVQVNYQAPATRLEVCELLGHMLRVKGAPLPEETETPFTDTDDPDVALLYHMGVIRGKSATAFCPYDALTREEYATILARLLGIDTEPDEEMNLSIVEAGTGYHDAELISDWAKVNIARMVQLGVMLGYNDGRFGPKDILTKEQTIITMMRIQTRFDHN